MQNIKALYGRKLAALDGDIGHVKDFFFDDKAWAIRYVVVDTGSWLTGRLVLLAPHAFVNVDQAGDALKVNLLKKQIQDSPSISSHEPVTRQFEEGYYRAYGWPVYWQGGQMWGFSAEPLIAHPEPSDIAVRQSLEPESDRHLQSAKTVTGYTVEATDGSAGHLTSFQMNARTWAIEDLVVESGHLYSALQVLIAPSDVERIGLVEKRIFVKLTKADIRHSAEGLLAKSAAGTH